MLPTEQPRHPSFDNFVGFFFFALILNGIFAGCRTLYLELSSCNRDLMACKT